MSTEREIDARAFLLARRGGKPLTFGALLCAIRLGEEETQAAFAARLGIPKQHLSDIEHGRRGVSVARAAAWATTLGYHAGQFVELAIEAQLRAASLPFAVRLDAARRSVRHAHVSAQHLARAAHDVTEAVRVFRDLVWAKPPPAKPAVTDDVAALERALEAIARLLEAQVRPLAPQGRARTGGPRPRLPRGKRRAFATVAGDLEAH